jgi:hypothetical protein
MQDESRQGHLTIFWSLPPEWMWDQPSFLYNLEGVSFSEVMWAECEAGHSP